MRVLGIIKRRLLSFRREAVILWFAFRDPRTPAALKLASLAAALYLVSPFDLIPFTIPFFGVVDDLVIVPLAVRLIARRLPPGLYDEAGRRADRWIARWFKRPLLALALILLALILVWAVLLYIAYRLLAG